MHAFTRLLALAAGLAAVGCRDAIAPTASRDLDVHVPMAVAHPLDTPSASLADEGLDGESTPPDEVPEEFLRPVTIQNFWTRVSIANGYAGAEAYMDYLANIADQTLSLTVLADGRQIATAHPARSGASWFMPVWGSLRTFLSIPVAGTCGISAFAGTQHHAKNELLLPGRSPWLFSEETVPSGNSAGQLMCPDTPQTQPPDDGGSSGGGGSDSNPDGDGGAYLSCWWKLTYEGDTLVDIENISCTIIS